ncbi:GH22447, partial [Drosophila grimshawi]
LQIFSWIFLAHRLHFGHTCQYTEHNCADSSGDAFADECDTHWSGCCRSGRDVGVYTIHSARLYTQRSFAAGRATKLQLGVLHQVPFDICPGAAHHFNLADSYAGCVALYSRTATEEMEDAIDALWL